ncbi:MAG: hypothetical protein LGR52_15980 [Candidatus Thiosymbion ectosymbiont of Robbea hypermnestra]|nr:hypothetical protein [Candidatus Thiosymbion ectosymbiont of Robbea hypermnestra]
MMFTKRAFPANLIAGICLMMIANAGNTTEDAVADEGGPLAELVRVEGVVTVAEQEQQVGASLEEGDLLNVEAGGIAVIEYRDGCRYTVAGSAQYLVNHAQCICYESLDASKHARHDAVAELGSIDGEVVVNMETSSPDGTEGMELKEGHRVIAEAESSARVEYYFGCDYTVEGGVEGRDSHTVNAEDCCLALGLPEEPVLEPAIPQPVLGPSLLIPALVTVTGIPAIVEEDPDETSEESGQ